jgi:17beta-estradiol 17-dehydrogenase / very-long-chain 3-oxoacyl-CoA reductase
LTNGPQLSKYGPKGAWAVVTGASDGIGREFALQLARRGFNLVLVSRTRAKLDALAAELAAAGASTRVLAMDFAQNRDTDYAALADLLKGLDVGVLVNNVGQSHAIPVPFLETPRAEMDGIIAVNCVATLRVTALVAPLLAARKGRGLILTMASFGGVFPTPLLATYSGSKAFLQHWSAALAPELAPSGVDVYVVQSHLVASAMSKIRRASAMVPSPKQFVRAALSKVGRSGGAQGMAYTGTPWWSHGLFLWAVRTTVGEMGSVALGQNLAMHKDIRRRALAKAEREAKKAQ